MSLMKLAQASITIGTRVICSNLDIEIEAGQRWALLGPNGSGKTTLLHCMAGLRALDSGSISLRGTPAAAIDRREFARACGVLFQEDSGSLPASVLETALLGRYPHGSPFKMEDSEELVVTRRWLAEFGLLELADRSVASLSGGEKQRLLLSTLFVQGPSLYLLDEPNNHLDLEFQVKLKRVLMDECSSRGCSAIMATHDINLAAAICDHVILMGQDGNPIVGTSNEVLNEGNLGSAFNCRIASLSDGTTRLFHTETN